MTLPRRQRLLSARCDELRRLGDGWDGPDSRAPSGAALAAVEEIVDRLEVVPLRSGAVAVGLAGFPALIVGSDGAAKPLPGCSLYLEGT